MGDTGIGLHELLFERVVADPTLTSTCADLVLAAGESEEALRAKGVPVTVYSRPVAKIAAVVLAGLDYGMGSSRDWAAKGTYLLGVSAVIAKSYERIHRSNLVGMGVLPCQFVDGTSAESLKLDGSEVFALAGRAVTSLTRLERPVPDLARGLTSLTYVG